MNQVGTGGFGAVYKAMDTQRSNRLVAIKEIVLSGLTPQQVIEATDAFNRELDTLVMQMLEVDINKRPATMAAVKKELLHIAAQQKTPKLNVSQPGGLHRRSVAYAQSGPPVPFSIQGVTICIYRGHRDQVRAMAWSPQWSANCLGWRGW